MFQRYLLYLKASFRHGCDTSCFGINDGYSEHRGPLKEKTSVGSVAGIPIEREGVPADLASIVGI